MTQKWSERPKSNRWMIVGVFIGMAIAAPIAFVFAYDADTIVRYLIMCAGVVIGGGLGLLAAKSSERS